MLLMSSLPTVIQRPRLGRGRLSNTVLRPSGSARVTTSPSGLL